MRYLVLKIRRRFDNQEAAWKYLLEDAVAYAHAKGILVPPKETEDSTIVVVETSELTKTEILLNNLRDHPWSTADQVAERLQYKPRNVSALFSHMSNRNLIQFRRGTRPRQFAVSGESQLQNEEQQQIEMPLEEQVVNSLEEQVVNPVNSVKNKKIVHVENMNDILMDIIRAAALLVDHKMLNGEAAFKMIREKIGI